MKVALSFPGCHRRGGVERIVFECASYLAANGHEVSVFANDWETNGHPISFEYVSAPKLSFLRGPVYFQQATRALSGRDFDVLNTHGVVCPFGGVHWAQSVHRAWLERSKEFRPPWSIGRLKQRLNPLHPVILKLEQEHFAKRRYRKIIATTAEVQKDLERFYDVPAEDVVVIPNGFSPTEFNPTRRMELRQPMRKQLGLKDDDVVLLLVANELDRKGYLTILSALKILDSPRLRLLVVGRPKQATVRKQAAMFGQQECVIACGATNNVAAFHAAADIFVLPTQYEAFCLAILEALGSGLPVVTSRIPGAQDAIRQGLNGYLVNDPRSGEELANVLKGLLNDDNRVLLSTRATESVQSFQWPVVLQSYEKVLQEEAV